MIRHLSFPERLASSGDVGAPAQSDTVRGAASAPIEAEEIGFALSVFVAAGNGHLVAKFDPETQAGSRTREAAHRFLRALDVAKPWRHSGNASTQERERSLDQTFLVLWDHYANDPRREAICTRVLNFYFLMERTAGTAVERWLNPCEVTELVALHPALVSALGSVPLDGDGRMDEGEFLDWVERTDNSERYALLSEEPKRN